MRGWTSTTVGEVCDLINGRAFKPTDWGSVGLPIVRIQNLKNVDAGYNYFAGEVREQFMIDSGQLLFAWSGTPGTSFGAHIWQGGPAILNQHIFRVQIPEAYIDKGFMRYALNQQVGTLVTQAHGGVGLGHVTKGVFESTEIALPPLAEQRRIVAKIDAITARTVSARAELGRVSALTARYRQAVLAAAMSGALTADRRAERGLPGPETWKWSTLGEIADVQSGVALGKKRPPGVELVSAPYLRVANVQRGWLDLRTVKTLELTPSEKAKLLLQPGDIVLNEGGDLDKLGRGWVWRGEVDGCVHQNHVFRLRLKNASYPPEYISYYTNEQGPKFFIDEGKQTTGLASISKTKLTSMPIRLPPEDEAREIVCRIEGAFAEIDRLAAEAAAARRLLDRLDQAILAKAFRGELVPQDPADEPASVMLELIRAERADAGPTKRRGRKPAAA